MKNKKKRKKTKKRSNQNQEAGAKKNLIKIKKQNLTIILLEVNHKLRIISVTIAPIITIKKIGTISHLGPDQNQKPRRKIKICNIQY